MDADCRQQRSIIVVVVSCLLCLCSTVQAASQRTQNFIIQAPTPQLAQAVAEAAERYRHDLAMYWLGRALPAWPQPCPIRVVAGPRLAAQGVTTYNPAPVRDFQMEVIGTPERILDSVLPHEITHTVLATYFGRPLPRWADEGICTTVEHAAERRKHEAKLQEFLRSHRGIAMNQLFLLTEYPRDVLPMYAQGYSVCRFLISQQGPRTFISFLEDYIRHPSWTDNIKKHYGYNSLAELQQYWLAWVSNGSGSVEKFVRSQITVPATQPIAEDRSPNHSPGGVVLAGGQRDNSTPIAQATGNPKAGNSKAGAEPIATGVGQLALNTAEGGLARPITHLTAVGTTTAAPRPRPQPLPATTAIGSIQPAGLSAAEDSGGVSSGNDYYRQQQNQAESIRLARGENGLSRIGTPMIPPSIRDSGRYGGSSSLSPINSAQVAPNAETPGPLRPASTVSQLNAAIPTVQPAQNYQTAHPQPEQQISRGGQWISPSRSQHSRRGSPQRY